MRRLCNNCSRVQTQAGTSEISVHENSGPTAEVFLHVCFLVRNLGFFWLTCQEYVLVLWPKESWRAVQGKGTSPLGTIVDYLGG